MPIVQLRYKPGRDLEELACKLAEALPAIVAPQLSIAGAELHDGMVTQKEIIVEVTEGSQADVNTKDLQITILAHNFPERVETDEQRKDAMLKGVRTFLADFDRNVDGFVWLILAPTAFGRI